MKYLVIISIFLFSSSCCATKEVAQQKEIAQLEETNKPEIAAQGGEFIPPKEDDSEVIVLDHIHEVPNVETEIVQDSITMTKVEKPVEAATTTVAETIRISFDHMPFDALLQKHVSDQGNVNYKGIKNEWKNLRSYIASLGNNMPTNEWSKEEKLAYWINAYNAMTIDLILRNYPVASIKDIKDPWKQRLWQLQDKWYNLDEIEHQIIRKMGEPRIHFALVCAAVSCPKLYNKAFTADNLEAALTKLTKEFLADTSKNTISPNEIRISKIFNWFAKDFKQNGSLIDFLNNYTDVNIASNAKKRFSDYNWDLNE